jgi:hypothetical protein
MDQDIDLRGSAYFNNKTKYKFTAEEVLNIKKDILAGIPVEVLAEKYNLTEPRISTLINKFIFKNYDTNKILGRKIEPYYNSETELFNIGENNYTWDSLTEHEKKFYLRYEAKEHNSKINRTLE